MVPQYLKREIGYQKILLFCLVFFYWLYTKVKTNYMCGGGGWSFLRCTKGIANGIVKAPESLNSLQIPYQAVMYAHADQDLGEVSGLSALGEGSSD